MCVSSQKISPTCYVRCQRRKMDAIFVCIPRGGNLTSFLPLQAFISPEDTQ